MPGKRDRNLRRGDMAEELGILFLKQLCAVANVPRPEDFGFDAVATILGTDGRYFTAEESFCVQIKTSSIRHIQYDRASYDWLLRLSLPLFIGSIDLRKGELALYTTHRVACRSDTAFYNT